MAWMCKCFCLYLLQSFKLNWPQIDNSYEGNFGIPIRILIEYPTKFGSIWDEIFLVDYLKGSNSWTSWKPFVKLNEFHQLIYALDHQLCKISDMIDWKWKGRTSSWFIKIWRVSWCFHFTNFNLCGIISGPSSASLFNLSKNLVDQNIN